LPQQTHPVPAGLLPERIRDGLGRRAIGIFVALLIEGLLLLLVLSLGRTDTRDEETVTLVDFKAIDASEPSPEPSESAEREPQAAERAAPRPSEPMPETPQPPAETAAPAALPPIPVRRDPVAPPAAGPRPIQQPTPGRPVYGPPGVGSSSGDTARVGTAPNGEPLYAARWYREPYDDELRGYLSVASGPGWGLIACRTAPDYRVEDCVELEEYPHGSQIARSALAASWQFKVRPPRLGGRSLVGAWVRIRIDYGLKPR
jgi:protein TonB